LKFFNVIEIQIKYKYEKKKENQISG